jgi:hypothetical protein
MPSLSFEGSPDARPIAIVKGGDQDKEVLYLYEDDKKHKSKSKHHINYSQYTEELKSFKPTERVRVLHKLQEALAKGLEPKDLVGETPETKRLYDRIVSEADASKEIHLEGDSVFNLIPSPDPKRREVWYVAGASGSGKSYIAKGYGEYYRKLFPDREVYLISKLTEDKTLDSMAGGKPHRISVDSLLEDYPEVSEFKDCMIIFDDIDCFEGAHLKVVHQLIDDLAITGRHSNTTLFFLTHYITNYKKTRLIINEATHFVVYPQATSASALKYLLATHIGMDIDAIKALRKMGRWVCVAKNYPQWLVASQTAKVIH